MPSPSGPTLTSTQLAELAGHRFIGGTYRIAHWENWLLTDCTQRDPLPDALVHPIALFHVPLLGSGAPITELFRLIGASGPGSVSLLGYDWEYLQPLREDLEYRCIGHIADAVRSTADDGRVADEFTFRFELLDDDIGVAVVTNRWRLNHMTEQPTHRGGPAVRRDGAVEDLTDGIALPEWTIESVDPARMKTMAAILRDPYPVHWDRAANAQIGLGGRVVNQGPLNVGYIANMLMAWAGPTCVRRLTLAFGRPVLDGDRVTAGGRVLNDDDPAGLSCAVWLERGGARIVTGTALVDTTRVPATTPGPTPSAPTSSAPTTEAPTTQAPTTEASTAEDTTA